MSLCAAMAGAGGWSGSAATAVAPTNFQMQLQAFVEKNYFKWAIGLLGGDWGSGMAWGSGGLVQGGTLRGRAGREAGVWIYLKVELTGSASGLDMECERKGRTKDESNGFWSELLASCTYCSLWGGPG